jgi:hypothetical protein
MAELPEYDGASRCYRHPDRETWVRCGRCDRPICSRCAMQGPVGFRCVQCGRPAFDPLTSFTPVQIVGGLALAIAAGTLAGLVATRVGFFVILIGWFGGGLIADAVMRFVGFKRGPIMIGILFGGILAGIVAAFAIDVAIYAASFGPDVGVYLGSYVADQALWAVVAAVVTCAGAYSRMR